MRRPRASAAVAVTAVAVTAPLAVAAAPLAGQEPNTVDEYREAIVAQRNVFLGLTGGRKPAYYTEDGPANSETKHPLARRVTFLVKQQRGLNLMLGFVNPIRHVVAVSQTVVEEPNYATVNRFAESLNGLAGTLGVSPNPTSPVAGVTTAAHREELEGLGAKAAGHQAPPGPGIPSKLVGVLDPSKFSWDKLRVGPYRPDTAKGRGKDTKADSARVEALRTVVNSFEFPHVFSPDLVLWTLLAADDERLACLVEAAEPARQLLGRVGDADAYLYAGSASAGDAPRPAAAYRRVAGDIPSALLAPDDLRAFRVALTKAAADRDSLVVLDDRTTTALAAAAEAAKDFATTLDKSDSVRCRNFANYTRGVIGNFDKAAGALLAQRVAARKALGGTLTDLATYVRDHATHDDLNALRMVTVEVPAGQMKDVTVVVQRRVASDAGAGLTLRDDTADTLTIRVRRRQTFMLEFAPGVAYLSNVVYPAFGTDTTGGRLTVQQVQGNTQRQAAIGMLNVLTPKVLGPVVPGVQLGIGTGRTYPILLAGGVARFVTGGQLSLSVGAAFPFYKELSQLRVGAPVSGTAAIEEDLRFRLGRASLYVGFQKGL